MHIAKIRLNIDYVITNFIICKYIISNITKTNTGGIMKDFLIGLGLGFAVGAVMVKSNKDVAKMAEKTKLMVEDTVSKGKEMIEDKITKPAKSAKSQK